MHKNELCKMKTISNNKKESHVINDFHRESSNNNSQITRTCIRNTLEFYENSVTEIILLLTLPDLDLCWSVPTKKQRLSPTLFSNHQR